MRSRRLIGAWAALLATISSVLSSAAAQTSTPASSQPSSRPASQPAVLFPPDQRFRVPVRSTTPISQRFKDIVATAERCDPRQDDMLSEAIAKTAEELLAGYAKARSTGANGSLPAAPGATAETLRPAALTIVFEDGPLLVRWPSAQARAIARGDAAARRPIDEAVDGFLAGLDLCRGGVEFAIIRVDDGPPGALVATTLVTAFGAAGERLQQRNATWRVTWTFDTPASRGTGQPAAGDPRESIAASRHVAAGLRISAIEPLDYEECEDSGPRLADCTAAVLGRLSGFDSVLQRGTDYWFRNMDRLWGVDLLGHTGLCVGDVNGDGLDDLYLAQPGGIPNALLMQQPDGTVLDKAAEANVNLLDMTRAGLLIDMDNDGDQDLVLSVRNATVIFENDGGGRFVERPVLAAQTMNVPSQFYSIAAADFDNDGFLDCYSTRYVRSGYGVDIPVPYFDANNGPTNHLISYLGRHPDGTWRFEERTEPAGLHENNKRFSLAASFEDFDDDGDQDLYVTNDFGRSNFYVQEGRRYRDLAAERGAENLAAGMGVSWADFDRDGLMDLYCSNMFSVAGNRIMQRPEFRPDDPPELRRQFQSHAMGNALFRGAGEGRLRAVPERLRSGIEGWSWGSLFVDLNNDGYEDLLVPNGNLTNGRTDDIDGLFFRRVASESPADFSNAQKYVDGWAAMSFLMTRDYSWAGRQRNVTYLNLRNGHFADISHLSGFGFLDDGRALATTDWDGDGDLDVWIRNRTAPTLRFLRNMTRERAAEPGAAASGNHWLLLRLVGTKCNRDAIGARVTIEIGGKRLIDTVRAGEGYLAQSSHWVHFGLGAAEKVDTVRVRWPGGDTETFSRVGVDGRYELVQGSGAAKRVAPRDSALLRLDPPPAATPTVSPGPVEHITLADRLPMPPFALPVIEAGGAGQVLSADALLGRPYVLVLWSPRDDASLAALRALAGGPNDGPRVVPVLVGAAEDRAAAVGVLRTIRAEWPCLEGGDFMLDAIDLIQQEVLGRPDDAVLPTLLVCDATGLLVALHRGGIGGDGVAADLGRPANALFPFQGRVMYPQRRLYPFLADEFRKRGHREAADFYRVLAIRLQEGQRR